MNSVSNINTGGSLDIIQSTFMLSMFSNGATWQTGSPAELQTFLQTKLYGNIPPSGPTPVPVVPGELQESVDAIGPWELVWGPCIYQNSPAGNPTGSGPVPPDSGDKVADNAIFVAYNATANVYVVAIAATNAQSVYDWKWLDAWVQPADMVNFPSGVNPTGCQNPAPNATVGKISAGTALGITNLLQMTPVSTAYGGQQNLQTFLKGVAKSSATLIFTGHSLAGALSPTIALWLYPQPSSSGWASIYVLPTAGATPGDPNFAAAFASAFPQTQVTGVNHSSYGYWNTLLWNQFDVVPHAWCNLSGAQPAGAPADIIWDYEPLRLKCESLYGPLADTAFVDLPTLIGLANDHCGNTIQNGTLTSTYYSHLQNQMLSSGYTPATVHTLRAFLGTAGAQHVNAYFGLFGLNVTADFANVDWAAVLCSMLAQFAGIGIKCEAASVAAGS